MCSVVFVLWTGVCLKLLGRAKVHWSVRRSKNNRTHYRSEEIYISEQVYVFGSREFCFTVSQPHCVLLTCEILCSMNVV